jgi:hypothetical protein
MNLEGNPDGPSENTASILEKPKCCTSNDNTEI